eukprot:1160527-Pelagomonas_calceolata.AAC.8
MEEAAQQLSLHMDMHAHVQEAAKQGPSAACTACEQEEETKHKQHDHCSNGHSHEEKHAHSHENKEHSHDHSHGPACGEEGHTHSEACGHGHKHEHAETPETRAAKRFGIRSFVYSSRRPFHPLRCGRALFCVAPSLPFCPWGCLPVLQCFPHYHEGCSGWDSPCISRGAMRTSHDALHVSCGIKRMSRDAMRGGHDVMHVSCGIKRISCDAMRSLPLLADGYTCLQVARGGAPLAACDLTAMQCHASQEMVAACDLPTVQSSPQSSSNACVHHPFHVLCQPA